MTQTNALYRVSEIRLIEQAATSDLPPGTLMQRAGKAAANAALALLGGTHTKVLVLAGPGNNGGDALEAAFHLDQAGMQVVVALFGKPEAYSADAGAALQKAQHIGVHIDTDTDSFPEKIAGMIWDLVIDGLFGIGLSKPLQGEILHAVSAVNRLHCPILALDVPSGLEADTGNIVGDGFAVQATHTITFIAGKPGLHTGHGRDYAGIVQVEDLQIDARHFPPATTRLNGIALFSKRLEKRRHNSHKGSYGDVAVVGGAAGMAGATILSARSAAWCGAGRVFAAFIDAPPAYDSQQPELMCRDAHAFDLADRTLVVGPGLGNCARARDMLSQALAASGPLVLDADALNILAVEPGLQQLARSRAGGILLTPHPLEAARLLNTSSKEVQADRLQAARQLAQQLNAMVVLKGSGTIIADPQGNVAINTNGNPGLATAGSGDVLAGICGALLAQHWPAWEAALGAVWLHGHAADVLVEHGQGPIGLTAGELIAEVRRSLNQLTQQHASFS